MNKPHCLARDLKTILGFAVFVLLAQGSRHREPSYHTLPPEPEEVGKENALAWAKTNSVDVASEIQAVESERNHVQSEIYRLENLQNQFPTQVAIRRTIEEWKQVEIELASALTSVEQAVSKAYVVHEVEGQDQDAILRQVFDQWRPEAERAIALAKRQTAKSNSEGSKRGGS